MAELNDAIHARIQALSRKGDALADEGRHREAIDEYVQGLELLPRPLEKWEASTWLFAAIGDAYWSLRDMPRAHRAFQSALRAPGGIGNPYVHLRMGQLEYEVGSVHRAADELMRAYMGGGREIFEGEDPKYFAVIADEV